MRMGREYPRSPYRRVWKFRFDLPAAARVTAMQLEVAARLDQSLADLFRLREDRDA